MGKYICIISPFVLTLHHLNSNTTKIVILVEICKKYNHQSTGIMNTLKPAFRASAILILMAIAFVSFFTNPEASSDTFWCDLVLTKVITLVSGFAAYILYTLWSARGYFANIKSNR